MQDLKRKLKLIVGLVDYNLSDSELVRIIRLIELTPKSERSLAKLQSIVRTVTGIDSFLIKESFDNSDIDSLIDQIIDTLSK